MSAETTSTQPPTRRERQRLATHDEIVRTARQLLREHDSISLRAVAQEMGMTPPALYRYVDGYDELLMLVADSIFSDIVASITRSAHAQAADDPAGQLVSAAVAFRQWALAHPEEFALIFASRRAAGVTAHAEKHGPGGKAFTDFFSDIYEQVWHRYQFPVPSSDDLPPGVLDALEGARDAGLLPCDFEGLPIGLNWIFMRAWSRLYGIVTLEVFGHLDEATIASGAMFSDMMNDNGRDLALGDDWPRLTQLIRDQLTG